MNKGGSNIRLIVNTMVESQPGFSANVYDSADTSYCRRNTIINHYPDFPSGNTYTAYGNGGTLIIADNYGYGNVNIGSSVINLADVQIYNNFIESCCSSILGLSPSNGELYATAKVFNNVLHSFRGIGSLITLFYGDLPDITYINNTFGSYTNLISGNSISSYTNNVLASSVRIHSGSVNPPPDHETFYYNCLSMALPDSLYDGGGNTIADPLFADTLALDYHLQAGSPCIDAGIVTDDLPAFDADYNLRVVGNTPDMGAYEYGSVYIGGIQGYVYDAQTLQPLYCAEVKISGKLPEFSDSLGCFDYPSGAGTYTLTVKRFDYADVVIPNVLVTVGNHTQLNIPMQNTVANDENINPLLSNIVSLFTYPNPFQSITGINFILPEKAEAKLAVYNLKGQKVASLTDTPLSKGYHSYSWDGKEDYGKSCSSGIYLVRLILNGKPISLKKITLVK